MSGFKEIPAFSFQFGSRKALIAALGLAFVGFAGWADASGGDKITPVKLAANAPGMIRTDTCSRPAHPEQELKQNHSGIVTLRLLLGADGRVKQSLIATSSGYPPLDEATVVAISKCSFNPPMVDGKPIDAWVHFQYDWKP